MDYIFLQNYWWFLVSLLGALLVFLLFVQGGNSLPSSLLSRCSTVPALAVLTGCG